MDNFKKPPLGLIPKEVHDWKRLVEIVNAIERYAEAEIPVDKRWITELKELLKINKIDENKDLAEKIYLILIEEGQHNLEFHLGSVITNTPDEVRDIIRKHIKDLT